jgi:hypothetical protein
MSNEMILAYCCRCADIHDCLQHIHQCLIKNKLDQFLHSYYYYDGLNIWQLTITRFSIGV